MKLPKWQCCKIVGACKIASVEVHNAKGVLIIPMDVNIEPFRVTPRWCEKYYGTEDDHGYFVEHFDGCQSWSSTIEFESEHIRKETVK